MSMKKGLSLQIPPGEAFQGYVETEISLPFETLYTHSVQRVYAYLLARTGQVADAQDLTSQTFMAALEAFTSYRAEGSQIAWLFGIARRKLVDFYRRRRIELPLETLEETPFPQPLPAETSEDRERFEKIGIAMQSLAPEQAEALALRIFSGLSVAETSRVMGKSEAAIKMLTCRALQGLRTLLSGSMMEDV